jgi:hypothetical protein
MFRLGQFKKEQKDMSNNEEPALSVRR